MKTRWSCVVAALAALVLPSCVESIHPLSKVDDAQVDEQLYGTWQRLDPNGTREFVHVGRDAAAGGDWHLPAGLMRYYSVQVDTTTHGLQVPQGYQFYYTQVGDDRIANWISPAAPERGKPETYFFVKYRVVGDELSVWIMDPEETARAIEAGRLEGRVRRKPEARDQFKELRITAPSEQIVGFLAAGGAASCFPDKNKLVYTRVP